MKNKYNFTTVINKEGKYYVAHNIEFGVVSQGESIEKAQTNLREALELYLEDVSSEELEDLKTSKPFITTLELEHA